MENKLAINGGNKTITINKPHYIWPEITKETEEAVLKQLHESISIYNKSGIIEELENRFAKFHNKKHALLTNSGTAALHSLFVGANLNVGDEIICPAYTFYATISPIFFTGATPVLVDCKENGNIDPEEIKRKITKKTKAIIITHMWGIPCKMDEIVGLVKEHNILLFEDASHAHFSEYKGKLIGTFGDGTAFSLQGQKTLTGGEGGIIITDDDNLFYRALLLGHYNKRCKREIPQDHHLSKFAVTGMGLKLRIHPLAAAVANQQFDKIENILNGRRRVAKKLLDGLGDLPGLSMPVVSDDIKPSWYGFVMQYKPEELSNLPIEKFFEALMAEGCEELDRPGSTCPLNYHPLFQKPGEIFPNYEGKLNYKKGDFPRAEEFHEHSLKLPVWHKQEDEKLVALYIEAFKKVINNYQELL